MRILAEIDLDDLLTLPSSTLYSLLEPLKKPAFDDDERIVLVAANDIPDDLIKHLRWCLIHLDIPEYFILLRTNSESNKSRLSDIASESLDDICASIDHGHRPIFDHLNLCAHMHTGLHVWPDGKMSPCCDYDGYLSDEDGNDLSLHDTDLQSVLAGHDMDRLRRSMIQGKRPKQCSKCWDLEEAGKDSRRTLAPYRLSNIYGKINWEKLDPISYIGSHPTNHCNLSCRICNSRYSSKIAVEDRKLGLHYTSNKSPIDKLYDQISGSKTIRSFEILGGEPFLMKQHLDYMDQIIRDGIAEESVFQFTTNGTVFPSFFNEDFRFKRLEITFSIDDIGQRFEYQRNGAKWDSVLANLESFKDFRARNGNVKLGVNTTVSILNVAYLTQLMDWFGSSGLDHHHFSILSEPSCLAIGNMTSEAKDLVLHLLDERFSHIKKTIVNGRGSDGSEFRSYIIAKDRVRQQDLRDHHMEIAHAMGL